MDAIRSDELDAAAALVTLATREPAEGKKLAARLDGLPITDGGARGVIEATRAALDWTEWPTLAAIFARIDSAGHGTKSGDDPARCTFVDLVAGPCGTYDAMPIPMAARAGADAVDRMAARHRQRLAAEACSSFLDRSARGHRADAAELVADLQAAAAAGRPVDCESVSLTTAAEEWAARPASESAIPTGFEPFDEATDGGLPVGEIVCLAAPPNLGKSALALQLVAGALMADETKSALWLLGEMSLDKVVQRLACVGSGLYREPSIDMTAAKARTESARRGVLDIAASLGERFRFLPPPLTIERIEAAAARMKPSMMVVDYLQLVRAGGEDRMADIEAALLRLRTLAINSGIAMIVISSMAKDGIRSGARIGTIGRGSGEIDYAMDLMFVGEAENPDDLETNSPIVWRCCKARHEERRNFSTVFEGRYQTFRRAGADPVEAFASFGVNGGRHES